MWRDTSSSSEEILTGPASAAVFVADSRFEPHYFEGEFLIVLPVDRETSCPAPRMFFLLASDQADRNEAMMVIGRVLRHGDRDGEVDIESIDGRILANVVPVSCGKIIGVYAGPSRQT